MYKNCKDNLFLPIFYVYFHCLTQQTEKFFLLSKLSVKLIAQYADLCRTYYIVQFCIMNIGHW